MKSATTLKKFAARAETRKNGQDTRKANQSGKNKLQNRVPDAQISPKGMGKIK